MFELRRLSHVNDANAAEASNEESDEERKVLLIVRVLKG
jgi:hypothetical protein